MEGARWLSAMDATAKMSLSSMSSNLLYTPRTAHYLYMYMYQVTNVMSFSRCHMSKKCCS